MQKGILAALAAVILLAGAAYAAPQKSKPAPYSKKKPALTVVKVCPITGEAVKGEGGGSYVVGKYKVYLCCAGCKADWEKLTAKQKAQKVAEAYKKQKAGTARKAPVACPMEKHQGKNAKKPADQKKPADSQKPADKNDAKS